VDDLLRATARAEARHFWFRGFRSFVHPLIQQALDGAPQARALDSGCGTGVNLALLTPYGAAFGLDISAVGLKIAHQRGANRLVRASAARVPFQSDCFDLVTSFDVLFASRGPAATRSSTSRR
jgi:SAM-dependent methyltransferase